LDNGKIISKMDLVFIFGLKKEVKINILEIDMKDIGEMEKEMDLESFIMPMELNMKDNGLTILNKDLHFSTTKMVKSFKEYLKTIECLKKMKSQHFKKKKNQLSLTTNQVKEKRIKIKIIRKKELLKSNLILIQTF